MNAHDSERVAGLLEDAGYARAPEGDTPDLVVFNTCAVRENAADRLYGNLGHLLPAKKAHAGMQIAVGGCLAQMEREQITKRAPWVDVVYGTHNIGSLPKLLERARERREAQVEFEETLATFPSLLPARVPALRRGDLDVRLLGLDGSRRPTGYCARTPFVGFVRRPRRPDHRAARVGSRTPRRTPQFGARQSR